MTVAQIIIKYLEQEGIDYAFGITGSHYLAFFKALKDSNIKFISVKHEGAAGFMALNYTKVSQKPALIMGTAGPGAANLIGAVAEMYKSGIPGIVLTPLVSRKLYGKNAFQEDSGFGTSYSTSRLMENITRKSILAYSAEKIPEQIRELFRYAITAPYGPVHLGIPSDLFDQEIDFKSWTPGQYRLVEDSRVEPEKLDVISQWIRGAENPVIMIGNRCCYPNCTDQLQLLIKNLQVPFVVSHGAKGLISEYQDLFGGVIDYFGHRSAEKLIKESDLVLALGFDFSEAETLAYDQSLFSNTKIISIDSDVRQFGMNFPVDMAIAGDIRSSLRTLNSLFEQNSRKNVKDSKVICEEIKNSNANQNVQADMYKIPLKIEFVYSKLSELLPQDSLVFADTGASSFSSIRHLLVRQNGFFTSASGYAMGQSVAGCIGGKCACPDKFIICICGDGAFLMHGSEVLTAVQYNLGISWMIFKEDFYNMIQNNQCLAYGGGLEFCTKIKNPDYRLLAQAYGVHFLEVNTINDLESGVKQATEFNAKNESVLIIINYDFEQHLPVKPQLVQTMKDLGQTKDIKSNPFLMKAFAKALKEKV
jgi:acetolactate synthase I/II/III large subunit